MVDISVVHSIYEEMISDDIILAYTGEFTQEMLQSFLYLIENKLERKGTDQKAVKKMYNVMVECIQNIVKHSGEEGIGSECILIISEDEDKYHVITGNYMEKGEVISLKDKLDHINSLSRDSLKKLYLKILSDGEISEKGGAGLGFIDMVRKTGNKLSYDFKELPEGKSFFTLKNTIHS